MCKNKQSLILWNEFYKVDQYAEEYRPVIVDSKVTLVYIRRSVNSTQSLKLVEVKNANGQTITWRYNYVTTCKQHTLVLFYRIQFKSKVF